MSESTSSPGTKSKSGWLRSTFLRILLGLIGGAAFGAVLFVACIESEIYMMHRYRAKLAVIEPRMINPHVEALAAEIPRVKYRRFHASLTLPTIAGVFFSLMLRRSILLKIVGCIPMLLLIGGYVHMAHKDYSTHCRPLVEKEFRFLQSLRNEAER